MTAKAAPATTPERQLFIAAFVFGIVTYMASLPHFEFFGWLLFRRQDLTVSVIAIAMFLVLPKFASTRSTSNNRLQNEPLYVALACLFVIAAAFAVRHFVLQSMLLSRDEQMVFQDAITFASGQRFMPMQPDWQRFALALNTTFFAPGIEGKGWLSDYKPVNALIHAVFLKVNAFAWAAPVMAASSVVLVWRIALRLWPDRADVRAAACLLFVCSAQLIVTAATPYAMTAHLFFNMLWLWLFLKDRAIAHVGAIIIGALATGLHQVPYHPAFALPFCALLLWRRQYVWSALYAVSYAAIIHLWMKYPFLPAEPGAVATTSVGALGSISSTLLGQFSGSNVAIMSSNLVRFFAWNHLLLLPLILIAATDPRVRKNPLMMAMLAAIMLTIAMKLFFRPLQGLGWGFRYMHGLIGVACLLAAEGWRRWVDSDPKARQMLTVSTLVTIFIAWPWLALTTYRFNAPFAAVEKKIADAPTAIVIVPDRAITLVGIDLADTFVFNRPDLARRPIRLRASVIADAGFLGRLCAHGTVGVLDPMSLQRVAGLWGEPIRRADPDLAKVAAVAPPGCLKPLN